VIRRPLDERVRERFIAEAGGNPLALLELPRGPTPAELAGAFGVTAAPGLLRRLEDSFRQRLGGLPETTQRLLLVAAAEPTGDPVLVWRAAGRLGTGMEAAAPAEAEGLLTIGARVTFRHPLGTVGGVPGGVPWERRAAHRALADATDPRATRIAAPGQPGQAAAGPDEEVAAELEHSAGRAQARGGIAAAAAFLDRAAWLTPEPHRRARRAWKRRRPSTWPAPTARRWRCSPRPRQAPWTNCSGPGPAGCGPMIAYTRRDSGRPRLLLRAAERLEPWTCAWRATPTWTHCGPRTSPAAWLATASYGRRPRRRCAHHAPAPPRRSRTCFSTAGDRDRPWLSRGRADAQAGRGRVPPPGRVPAEELRWLWAASVVTRFVWDDESQDVLSARHVELGRQTGVLAGLPIALSAASWCTPSPASSPPPTT